MFYFQVPDSETVPRFSLEFSVDSTDDHATVAEESVASLPHADALDVSVHDVTMNDAPFDVSGSSHVDTTARMERYAADVNKL